MIGDIPRISDAAHSHTVYGLGNMGQPINAFVGTTGGGGAGFVGGAAAGQGFLTPQPTRQIIHEAFAGGGMQQQPKPQSKETDVTRRLVQVFIADPNESIPLEDSLLYSGDQKLTDLTDQELFFEIDMKGVLATHNAKRVKVVDKKVKERTEYLEPAKIRELRMVVVTVASF